jgi:hypothetical protein
MRRSLGTRLLPLAAAAAVLALPGSLRAACTFIEADFDGNGTSDLRILGDPAKQTLILFHFGTGSAFQLDCNSDGDYSDPGDVPPFYFTAAGAESFDIQLKGKDSITVNYYSGHAGDKLLTSLMLGPGGNSVTISGNPAVALNASANASHIIEITGGSSTDVVNIDLNNAGTTTFNNSYLAIRGDLGGGNDTLTVKVPQNQTGSGVDVDLGLGTGQNTATVDNRSGHGGTFQRFDIEGGDVASGVDTVYFNFQGFDNSTSRTIFNANLRSGNDVYVASFTQNPLYAYGWSRFRVNGGAGNDSLVIANPTPTYGTEVDGIVDVGLRGGVGNDILSVDQWFGFFSNSGRTFRLWMDGGEGADTVLTDIVQPLSGTGIIVDATVLGGRGADILYLGMHDTVPNGVYTPMGTTLLSGGHDGNDACIPTTFNPLVEQLNCEITSF